MKMNGIFIPIFYLCNVNKKENILLAALELLVENGLHATPMSAIAKAANTGMGTIYNYFANKEALINAIYVDIKQQEEIVLSAFLSDQPIKTQFEKYYTSVVGFFLKNPLFFKFMEQLQASPIITNESREVGYKAVEPVMHLLEKGKEERIVKEIDTNELLLFIGGAMLSYLRWYFNQAQGEKNISLQNQLVMVWDAIKE